MTDRVDQLFEDIVAGPAALAALLDAYGQPEGPLAFVADRPARVAFTGLGSSRYAALTVTTMLRAAGLPAWTEYASTSTPTAPADDLVLVAVSASGGTPEVVQAAHLHRGRSRVIAVTNRTDSPLAGAGRPRPAAARRGGALRYRHADVPGDWCRPGPARRSVAGW